MRRDERPLTEQHQLQVQEQPNHPKGRQDENALKLGGSFASMVAGFGGEPLQPIAIRVGHAFGNDTSARCSLYIRN